LACGSFTGSLGFSAPASKLVYFLVLVTGPLFGKTLWPEQAGGEKMAVLISTAFWVGLLIIGFGALVGIVVTKKTELLNNTAVAVTISMIIALAYFTIVNDYLMDFQGLDYWYLFRE
jgi:hypothetical protein